jgi:hypothetical protein
MLVNLRDTIVLAVDAPYAAAWSAIPLVWENQPFDWSNLPERYVTIEIVVHDAVQATLSNTAPRTRVHGCVYVYVHSREGLGSRAGLLVLDWFADLLRYRFVDPLQFRVPKQGNTQSTQGWYRQALTLPFFADQA